MRLKDMVRYFVLACVHLVMICIAPCTFAEDEKFLSQDQAFIFEPRSLSQDQVQLHWTVAPDYYLYKHQLAVNAPQQIITLDLPLAQAKHDDYFGDTEVYYHELDINITVKPNTEYRVNYQGCAEKGLCYPLAEKTFQTDAEGLVILANATITTSKATLMDAVRQTTDSTTTSVLSSTAQNATNQDAQDQHWSNRLQQQSFLLSVLIFLGLGCLLAFTPCSLPMLPILSSLLVRKHEGVKAIFISLTFVFCMASVYALLGLLAASAGSNFQRWLQQPVVLIGFASIFIVFALNLFGLFELKLPHKISNLLDQLQAKQQGGTLIGAGIMGMLSALLVGPCMTAPLAGTLLYISQTQNMLIGAALLFSLGLGMGIPLLLLTLVGEKALPKPGAWMAYVRHVFAFLMLGMSIYFVRPLLSEQFFNISLLAVILTLLIYLVVLIKKEVGKIRALAVVVLLVVTSGTIWQSLQYWHYQNLKQTDWKVVETQQEFQQQLQWAQQQQKNIVVDVYADWCVACQPLEREVWANPKVQASLEDVIKIKLDLSDYHLEQSALLSEWQLLGPPTALFLDAKGVEQRHLRLTGSFTTQKLTDHLTALKK